MTHRHLFFWVFPKVPDWRVPRQSGSLPDDQLQMRHTLSIG